MGNFALLAIEVAVSLGASVLVVLFWSASLKKILVDICGSEERAAFWLTYSNIMLFITPLLSVVLFGQSGQAMAPDFAFLKRALGTTLLGLFFAVAAIGIQIAKFVPRASSEKQI